MTKCKGHPLEVFCCGDIIGYFCDLFLGHYVFDALYLVYLSTLINEFSIITVQNGMADQLGSNYTEDERL